ncbi:MAG: YgaP-like transmembrane domain, partial [Acetobacteraceae bacterium]
MVRNVSERERAIRVGAGSVVILLGLFLPLPMWAMLVLVLLGLVGLVTGLVGFCP